MEWSDARRKQGRQKVCPQGVVTGSYSSFKHSVQSMSSVCSSEGALLIRQQYELLLQPAAMISAVAREAVARSGSGK